ncbi:hypothetical protein AK830_g9626 [Neonectria ditissima]|uniref:F-box domain-containing protein n=1 Tax=Neonectria ditissima TaxID=78410 RepID=A0A0P7B926_9HYPO|nr:hypothetical protein AK830_g9626 [Neonectria ditissima]
MAQLSAMPPELALHIASFIPGKGLDALTRTSKANRRTYGCRLFSRVRFEGSEVELSKILLKFCRVSLSFIDIHASVRHATIIVRRSRPCPQAGSSWRDSLDYHNEDINARESLPIRIASVIAVMSGVRSLVLDIEKMRIASLLHLPVVLEPQIRKWGVDRLRIASSGSFFSVFVLKACKHRPLRALHIQRGFARDVCDLAKYHVGLKRLQISASDISQYFRPFPSMKSSTLDMISKFKHLEWLVINEDTRSQHLSGVDAGRSFETLVRRFILSVQKFPDLKYFAFTVWRDGIGKDLLNDGDLDGPEPTPASITKWVAALAVRMGEALPELEQLCILLAYPEVVRCTRTQRGAPMRVKWERWDQTNPPRGFPFELSE